MWTRLLMLLIIALLMMIVVMLLTDPDHRAEVLIKIVLAALRLVRWVSGKLIDWLERLLVSPDAGVGAVLSFLE